MRVFELHPAHNEYKTIGSVVRMGFPGIFSGAPISAIWQPIEMQLHNEGRKRLKQGDFPGHPIAPIFSQRAVEALRDILETSGELLPVPCGDEIYYAFNVLNIVDAVDDERSEKVLFSDGAIMRFTKFVFKPEKLLGQYIFKIPLWKHGSTVFVTGGFETRLAAAGLLGFDLHPLWEAKDK